MTTPRSSIDDDAHAADAPDTRHLSELQRAGLALRSLRARLNELDQRQHEPIAVVGMACRFPGGAVDPETYWELLVQGVDAVSDVPAWRWDREALYDPRPGTPGKLYTLAAGWLEDVEWFDAAFFGIAPREALNMDPQQRLLLETCWTAMEDAGERVERLTGAPAGLFLGVTSMDYAHQTIQAGRPELLNGYYTTGVSFNGGAGRVGYVFGFNGPCLAVDTACSSSLVALHLALRSLRTRECALALAAGVNVNLVPGNSASMCEAQMLAPSGRCRSFDAQADGLVRGEGCGVLVLKRLSDALAQGNHILALIRGSAVNQDGASSSLTAPNGRAQEAVFRAALEDARVAPHEVDYVEAHGSATPLGDPIEVRSLSAVYGAGRDPQRPLWTGSVKANLGHLEAAAGMAGLQKVILSLRHARMVRQLHFTRPNPEIDWERAGVQVCAQEREWERPDGRPRRAAVSGFGVSGTNAHVVLEAAPPPVPGGPSRSHHTLVLSAPTPSALETLSERLAQHLRRHPEQDFADVVYTLQTGRQAFAQRRVVWCADRAEALDALSAVPARAVTRQVPRGRQRPVCFLFPGTGEHYAGMGRGLYDEEPLFREELERCGELLRGELGCELVELLYGSAGARGPAEEPLGFAAMVRGESPTDGPLARTLHAHAAVFALEYALGRLLMAWGLQPQLLLGYSTGEYVAACLAGVMSLPDAVRVVARRAALLERQPAGAMLSVMAGARELQGRLGDGLWLAAINSPQMCVVAGEVEPVQALAARLSADGVACRRVGVQHAFHTPLVAGIERELLELLRTVELKAPEIPVISNVTGERLSEAEARDPRYWFRHAVSPVLFAAGVATLWSRPERVLIEVGPGQALCSFALQQGDPSDDRLALVTLSGRYEQHSDAACLQSCLGRLWLHGGVFDWRGLYGRQSRRKLPLPTYPFERERFWIDNASSSAPSATAADGPTGTDRQPLEDWYYAPEWRRRSLEHECGRARGAQAVSGAWLVLGEGRGLRGALCAALRAAERRVVVVDAGTAFSVVDDHHVVVDPKLPEHQALLVHHLRSRGILVRNVVHLWSSDACSEALDARRASAALDQGFYSLLGLLSALGESPLEEGLSLVAVTAGAQAVLGDDLTRPEHALLDGVLRVAPQELRGLRCCALDLPDAPADEAVWRRWAGLLIDEFALGLPEDALAYRGTTRWVREFVPLRLGSVAPEQVPLRREGVYLVTGGLGGLGLTLATWLAEHWAARLVLLGRSLPPPEEQWEALLARGAEGQPEYDKVRGLMALRQRGAQVLVLAADVADRAALAAALDTARARFGPLNGVFHCAGVPGAGLILTKRREACEAVFAPKLAGTLHLAELCAADPLDLTVYFSSVMGLYGAVGQADYAGANAFLDAFAHYQQARGVPARALDWGMWRFDSWQERLTAQLPEVQAYLRERRMRLGITSEEGLDALQRVLRAGLPQVVVSPLALQTVRREHREFDLSALPRAEGLNYARPARLTSTYVAPQTDTQRVLEEIWRQAFGLERIGIQDDFVELGGHSLLGSRIVAEAGRRFGISVSLRTLFAAPTLERFAEALEEQILADIEALPEEPDAGERALSAPARGDDI